MRHTPERACPGASQRDYRRPGLRPARPHAGPHLPADGLPAAHLLPGARQPGRAGGRPRGGRPVRGPGRRAGLRAARWTWSPSSSRTCRPRPPPRRPSTRRSTRTAACCEIAQNRLREKESLAAHGFPVTPFRAVRSAAQARAAAAAVGLPAILKSAGFGYDGKGQAAVSDADRAEAAWTAVTGYSGAAGSAGSEPAAILERRVDFTHELSVIAARAAGGGRTVTYPPCENRHADGILDLSSCPAEVPPAVGERARAIACDLMEALDVVGVLCVELFLTTDGELLVNEIAPRPAQLRHTSPSRRRPPASSSSNCAPCAACRSAPPASAPPGGDGQPARRPVGRRPAALGTRGRDRRRAPAPVRQGRAPPPAARWATSPPLPTPRGRPARWSAPRATSSGRRSSLHAVKFHRVSVSSPKHQPDSSQDR